VDQLVPTGRLEPRHARKLPAPLRAVAGLVAGETGGQTIRAVRSGSEEIGRRQLTDDDMREVMRARPGPPGAVRHRSAILQEQVVDGFEQVGQAAHRSTQPQTGE
jgi:hypothetical protein